MVATFSFAGTFFFLLFSNNWAGFMRPISSDLARSLRTPHQTNKMRHCNFKNQIKSMLPKSPTLKPTNPKVQKSISDHHEL